MKYILFFSLLFTAGLKAQKIDRTYQANGTFSPTWQNKTIHSGNGFPSAQLPDGGHFLAYHRDVYAKEEDLVLLKLKPDGEPDLSFGPKGMRLLRLPSFRGHNAHFVADMRLDDRGRILLLLNSGYERKPDGSVLCKSAVACIDPKDGQLDRSFGKEGVVFLGEETPNPHVTVRMAWDAQRQRILVAEQERGEWVENRLHLWALKPDGTLDQTWGNKGGFVYSIPKYGMSIPHLMADPRGDGWLLWTDISDGRLDEYYALIKVDHSGRLVQSHGQNGTRRIPNKLNLMANEPQFEWGGEAQMLPDGRILIVGFYLRPLPAKFRTNWLVACFRPDGLPDRSFGNNGLVFGPESTPYSQAGLGIQQADGKIIVALEGRGSNNAVMRLTRDGKLDASFGNNGIGEAASSGVVTSLFWLDKGRFMMHYGYTKLTRYQAVGAQPYPQVQPTPQPQPVPQPQPTPPPVAEEPEPAPGDLLQVENVHFHTSQSTLKPESYRPLNELAAYLKRHPQVKLEISGHTDLIGNADANMRLSKERAEAVRDYLIAHDIAPNRLTAQGFGDTRPLFPNPQNEAERLKNRRVEFKVL